MRPLSAVEAIGPAWSHAARLLFARRSWRTYLKIALVAFFAEAGGCNSFQYNGPSPSGAHNPFPALTAALITIFIFVAIFGLILALAFFYLSSRLQLTLFDMLLRSDTRVAPSWKRFGSLTWKWIGLKLLYSLAALICLLPVLIPAIIAFVRMAKNPGVASSNIGAFVLGIFGFIALIFIVILLISAVYSLIKDFGLPSLALENTSIRLTLRRIVHFIRAEPGQVFFYLVMLLVLRLAGVLASYVILAIITLISLIPLGGISYGLYAGLHQTGVGGHAFMIIGWVVCGIVLLAIFFTVMIALFGFMFAFLQSYALYFLGGRYPLLATFLEGAPPTPSETPTTPTRQPVFPLDDALPE